MKLRDPFFPDQFLEARIVKDRYANNSRMYIGIEVFDPEYLYWVPWSDLTVNIPGAQLSDDSCVFIDSNNNPTACEFITSNNIGECTGRYAYSGFCAYPEYRIKL